MLCFVPSDEIPNTQFKLNFPSPSVEKDFFDIGFITALIQDLEEFSIFL